MDFKYSPKSFSVNEKVKQRLLEIIPGALSWSIILGLIVLSIIEPISAAVFMIAFLLYWLLRLVYMNIFLVLSYLRLEIEKDTDWISRLHGIGGIEEYFKQLCSLRAQKGIRRRISSWIHGRQIAGLKRIGVACPRLDEICHLVIIPVAKETKEVVEPGIKAIKEGGFTPGQIMIVIALEDRAPEETKLGIAFLKDKYSSFFLDFLIVRHPSQVAGEARVKGANVTHAARFASQELIKRNIKFDNVLVSCFDADTVAHKNYFSCLTYHFMIAKDRSRVSFQPIPVYHNNIWDAPGFARIIDIGTSFFQLIESTNPKKLVTFSSHSMSFKALVDVGYWPVDMISDDSAIFWKAFIHYDGDYRVAPIYTTVSMDIATGPTMRKTFLNIYKQKRRWAWGVENIPVVIRAFIKSKKIPFYKKLSFSYKLFDAFISWSTWSFILLIGTWLPGFFATRQFTSSTLYYTAPRIKGIIFSLASVGLVICMAISIMILPERKRGARIIDKVKHVFEWLFIPLIMLALSAIPALDAQTRLMFGRYLEFWVSEKFRS